MKGLLLKDFYVAKEYCRSYILIVIVFLGVSCFNPENLFFLFYPSIFCGLIVETLLAYDEKCGFLKYGGALPYTKAGYVDAKYLFGVIVQFAVYLITCITYAISLKVSGKFDGASYRNVIALIFAVSALAVSVSHPFIFRYGVEKGRIAYYVLIGAGCAAGVLATYLLNDQGGKNTASVIAFPLFFLFGIAVYVISWRISVRVFEKRDIYA